VDAEEVLREGIDRREEGRGDRGASEDEEGRAPRRPRMSMDAGALRADEIQRGGGREQNG